MSDATVFVVDDDAAIRDALSLLISLRGLRTQVFESAGHFLDTYRSEWRGCLLADLQMPGMSGLELQAELKARGIALPVIVLTAHGDVAAARAALKNAELTPAQLREMLIQIAQYSGYPRAAALIEPFA